MSRLLQVLSVIGLLVLGLTVAVAAGGPSGGTDPQQNPPRDPSGEDGPGGGLCPVPWPVNIQITGFTSQGVDIQSAAGETSRSIERVPGRNFKAVICRDDTISWEAASPLGPGLSLTNNHSEGLRIEWSYDDGSTSGVVTIPPGGSVFHSLTGNVTSVELLDPGLQEVTGDDLDPV